MQPITKVSKGETNAMMSEFTKAPPNFSEQ